MGIRGSGFYVFFVGVYNDHRGHLVVALLGGSAQLVSG